MALTSSTSVPGLLAANASVIDTPVTATLLPVVAVSALGSVMAGPVDAVVVAAAAGRGATAGASLSAATAAERGAPMISISNGSLPRLTEMLLALLAVSIDAVPVSGSNTSIADAASGSVTVTLCVVPPSFHSPIQKEPSDFSISIELSVDCVPDKL